MVATQPTVRKLKSGVVSTAGSARPVDGTEQLVAGTAAVWLRNYARSLPQKIDDATRDFGANLYERMMFEPAVASNVQLLTAAVIENGPSLRSPIEDEKDPDYQKALDIRDALADQLDDLPGAGFESVLLQLAQAVWRGNKVVEMSYRIGKGAFGPTTTIVDQLAPKPWENLSFVVDAYNTVIGLLGRSPQVPMSVIAGTILNPKDVPNLFPREKFLIFSWAPNNNDPRGTSILRPVYNAWWRKQQLVADYLRYLAQFASPSLFGTTAEGTEFAPLTDTLGQLTDGDQPPTPEDAFRDQIETFYRNGGVLVGPGGYKLDVVQATGSGETFAKAIDYEDLEIAIGITLQSLAQGEAQFGTRSQATVHQDMFGLLVRLIRRALIRCVQRDFIRQWIIFNVGEDSLKLAPELQLGESQSYDLPALMGAIAALRAAKFVGASQLPYYDKLLGAPDRDLDYDEAHPLDPPAVAPTPPVLGPDGRPLTPLQQAQKKQDEQQQKPPAKEAA